VIACQNPITVNLQGAERGRIIHRAFVCPEMQSLVIDYRRVSSNTTTELLRIKIKIVHTEDVKPFNIKS